MTAPVILIGLGANLPSPGYGAPKATLTAALERFEAAGLHVTARARWHESEGGAKLGPPDFTKAVGRVGTELAPAALLGRLHRLENELGRGRAAPRAPRAH